MGPGTGRCRLHPRCGGRSVQRRAHRPDARTRRRERSARDGPPAESAARPVRSAGFGLRHPQGGIGMTTPVPTLSNELKEVLRAVKLGRCLDTLPERLALARAREMGHAEFLELVLSDEVTRRETTSAALRAKTAGLDPSMSLENWDETTKVNFDHAVWDELCSLRFVDAGHNVLILGPVGVGKTFMASALGHAASRRRYTVSFQRTDVLLKRLRASRLDNSHDAELRKLIRVDLLILDDFVLQPLDPLVTADIYELIVE